MKYKWEKIDLIDEIWELIWGKEVHIKYDQVKSQISNSEPTNFYTKYLINNRRMSWQSHALNHDQTINPTDSFISQI